MPLDEKLFGEPRFVVRTLQRTMRILPSNPRCKVCYSPFGGIGGRIVRFAGFAPSRKNPTFCTACFEKAPPGGKEMDVGVFFADIRGFTTLSETTPNDQLASLLNRFYDAATKALVRQTAIIDKLVGDEVMALFLPYFMDNAVERMCDAAEELLEAAGFGGRAEPWLPIGIGIDFGRAFVGNVGTGEVKDFTAIGDVVNTASRLQAEARPGQMVIAERSFAAVADRYPGAPRVELQLKGKSEPVAARIVGVSDAVGSAS